MDTKKAFPLRLAELRKEKGLTQGELADKIGISRQSVTLYEREARIPDIEVLAKLAEFFEVTSDYLIGLEDCRTHEAADISARTGLTDAAVAVLTFLSESDFPPTVFLEMISGLIEKSTEKPGEEWDEKKDGAEQKQLGMTDNEISELKQEYAKERAIGLQCRHGADVLNALGRYYLTCASYEDNFFAISGRNGEVIQNDVVVDILRRANSHLLFNGKEILEKILLDKLVDTIKQGAKEFSDEHPELRHQESAHADEE